MIPSLRGASGKMSSSVKESFISIRDKKKDIEKKINKAYCPGREIKDNPIVAIARLIIFPKFGELHVEGREKKDTKTFKSYEEFEEVYRTGDVWPSDLKKAVADYLEEIIAPIRKNWK
jgi:tyrosyl-tRNA synthetase